MKKRPLHINATCCTLIMLLSSCNLMPSQDVNEPVEQETTTYPTAKPTISVKNEDVAVIGPHHQRKPFLQMGNGQYIGSSFPKEQLASESVEGDITLNFEGNDLNEFIKAVLDDQLKENYIIDPKVSGTVILNTSKPFSKKELMPLLEEALAINNAVIIKSGDLYQILPREKAVNGNLSSGSGYKEKFIQLEYIAAKEMQKILEPYIRDGGSVRVNKQRNILIISGTTQELSNLEEAIELFDIDWLRGKSVGLYPLEYVDSKTLKSELDAILLGIGGSTEKELLGGLVRILSIERLNSILLISSTTAALQEAETWLHRLDHPGEESGQHLYVYKVQNARATELADILGQFFDDESSNPIPALAPGTMPVEIVSDNNGNRINASSMSSSDLSLATSGSIKIIADDTRNSLVTRATPIDYKMVEAAIRKLDVVPLQVSIEASILEVTLNDNLNYGVEWFFKNGIGRSREGEGQLDLGDVGISALGPGFAYTIINSAKNIRVALNLLEEVSEIKVLSSPMLMVLDNQTATINVGDEIPIATRSSVSNADPNAPSVNEIDFRNTGVTLTVTPRVNNSGLVTMEIKQEVSQAIDTTTSNIDSPTIQQRQINSTVAINSEETVILGGLIQDIESQVEGGIPFLYKLPLIGKLFGQTNNTGHRTELIVLITPKVVHNKNDARKITDEFRRKLRSLPLI